MSRGRRDFLDSINVRRPVLGTPTVPISSAILPGAACLTAAPITEFRLESRANER